jgi:hypothetical protein
MSRVYFFLVRAQVLQGLPAPMLVSPAAVIDRSQSKKSQEKLKLQITPFSIDKTKLPTFHVPKELLRAVTPGGSRVRGITHSKTAS